MIWEYKDIPGYIKAIHRSMKKEKAKIGDAWTTVLRSMPKNELQLVVYKHEDYAPDIVTIAKDILMQDYGLTEEELHEQEHLIKGDTGSRDLLLDVLEDMGCRVFFENEGNDDEDDGECDISFYYQGKDFYANASNDREYVTIDHYHGARKFKEVALVKEAINVVNEKKIAKMYYQRDETTNLLFTYSCSSFLFIPLIPNLETYLHFQFKAILKAEELFAEVQEQLKAGG